MNNISLCYVVTVLLTDVGVIATVNYNASVCLWGDGVCHCLTNLHNHIREIYQKYTMVLFIEDVLHLVYLTYRTQ